MAMIVAHNLNAFSTQRNLDINNRSMSGSLERLSTGYKINTAKDDPSGLVISEQLRAQTIGLTRAVQNTQEANNVLGIAEGALNEMNNILNKMKQLAVHAANNGVTSPEQVSADQAEIDSSIQTLDRIARTTKFSDQFLLNGGKELSFDSSIIITDSNDHRLLDTKLSNIKQIFKHDDFKLNINFSGVDQENGVASPNGNQAQKGYFEITPHSSPSTEVVAAVVGDTENSNYTLSKDQAFVLTGPLGSRSMAFSKGIHMGELVTSVNSVVDSTGIEANLIFDSNTTSVDVNSTATMDINATTAHVSGTADVFNRTKLGEITTAGVTAVAVSDPSAVVPGLNCDGYGRIYAKMVNNSTIKIYKDEAMTMELGKANTSSGTLNMIEMNNSGLSGLNLTLSDMTAGMTSTIQLAYMQEDTGILEDGIDFSMLETASSTDGSTSMFDPAGSYMSGIDLGNNTTDTGKLYLKVHLDSDDSITDGDATQIFVYKDERMRDEDLVAMSDAQSMTAGGAVRVYGVQVSSSGETSGLYGTLNFGTIDTDMNFTTVINTENLGVRLSTQEYGSDEFIKVEQSEGALFTYYTKLDGANLLDAGLSGAERTDYGSDAVVAVNGQEIILDGIRGSMANLDAAADLVFNQGTLGCTTIATVGYDIGSYGSRAGQMYNADNNFVNHALKSTTETLGDWTGGMQFQLGEGAGDQERTVFSIQDMTAVQLGKVRFSDTFTEGSSVKSEKYLTVTDMLAGGMASLSEDPIKAMAIIDQAITDVSGLRADIGAFQANMLETNANSLSVAVENITKTESYIRDADMAYESTQFSKNQVMVQAGTSMLAQANQLAQNALSLLQ